MLKAQRRGNSTHLRSIYFWSPSLRWQQSTTFSVAFKQLSVSWHSTVRNLEKPLDLQPPTSQNGAVMTRAYSVYQWHWCHQHTLRNVSTSTGAAHQEQMVLVQFTCFQNERRCNKHLSFCLTAPFCTASRFPVLHCWVLCLSSSAQLLCTCRSYYDLHTGFPPMVEREPIFSQAAHCCLRLETRRKNPQVSGVWPKIVPPYGCKDSNCSRVSVFMLPILYM